MHEHILILGRGWAETPTAWKAFVRSLPTHTLVMGGNGAGSRLDRRRHSRCMRQSLAVYDAVYLPSSRRSPARLKFQNDTGRWAWELAYG